MASSQYSMLNVFPTFDYLLLLGYCIFNAHSFSHGLAWLALLVIECCSAYVAYVKHALLRSVAVVVYVDIGTCL